MATGKKKQKAPRTSDEIPDGSAERALWTAVLANAFADAKTPEFKNKDGLFCVPSAREYLVNRSRGLANVCEWAEVDMDWIIRKAKDIEAEGWVTQEEQDAADRLSDIRYAKKLEKKDWAEHLKQLKQDEIEEI